ncbi:EpsG family protein [Tamlana sp. 2_MG-2023]|uniref:EpsG family protein n=1 Tax=unclassified Tamlana TaxID=2614803 RepID=UPI0026E41D48|nr:MULTISPECIES: EpsG family protein [unclassified Tamlana]MDO6759415.1 EpsG family protein [Tamlana sp. 2_MG-2023]MDO6790446.1 EpsG family protein [Tamlana sp. 1_MG-2023]
MIEFIPLDEYYLYYINISLAIVLFTLIHSWLLEIDNPKNIVYINSLGYTILIILTLYIGLRPISGIHFSDMATYAKTFNYYKVGGELKTDKDVFFELFTKFCSSIMTINIFFLFCATLYIYPMFRVSKIFFKEYWFYSFLLLVVSFSFWAYGVNGIRNGIATSIFLLAVSFYKNKIVMIALLVLSTMFHKTMLLPVLAFSITFLYNNPKIYLMFWILAIPCSIALGGFWENLFATLGFADDRLGGYLSNGDGSSKFRFDFLFYSSFPIIAGFYYILKKGFDDKLYNQLLNTYLISNAFWILVIRAAFSNRFAYLSWFLMAVLIIYPLLKERHHKYQHLVIGQIVLAYFGFTYLMFSLYYTE